MLLVTNVLRSLKSPQSFTGCMRLCHSTCRIYLRQVSPGIYLFCPWYRCHVQGDLGIVVELQLTSPSAVTSDRNRLVPQAWTKISVFDDYGQLSTGRFHIPFRVLPISPLLSFRDMETLPRVSLCIIQAEFDLGLDLGEVLARLL